MGQWVQLFPISASPHLAIASFVLVARSLRGGQLGKPLVVKTAWRLTWIESRLSAAGSLNAAVREDRRADDEERLRVDFFACGIGALLPWWEQARV